MNEFQIIDQFFKHLTTDDSVATGIGDDCAILNVPVNHQLLVTSDTLNEGSHFPVNSDPELVGYRTCATALSDIAAMGGVARWASLALTLPKSNDNWLQGFVRGIASALAIDKTTLVGGDLTRGPLSVSWHITGFVPANRALQRTGATVGDVIYVSGDLGGAAYALNFLDSPDETHSSLVAYWSPQPRLALGRALLDHASSCIDISDGLLADLAHVLDASAVGAVLDRHSLPVHPGLAELSPTAALEYALNGGDDYELCFTVPPSHSSQIEALAASLNIKLSAVGRITLGSGIQMDDEDGKIIARHAKGFRHFE